MEQWYMTASKAERTMTEETKQVLLLFLYLRWKWNVALIQSIQKEVLAVRLYPEYQDEFDQCKQSMYRIKIKNDENIQDFGAWIPYINIYHISRNNLTFDLICFVSALAN